MELYGSNQSDGEKEKEKKKCLPHNGFLLFFEKFKEN